MKISVISACRGRAKQTINSINSLYNQADNPNEIEFIFRFDDDDIETIETIKNYYKDVDINLKLLSGERYGFYFLNEYLDECIKDSSGDFILYWANDYEMSSKNEYCWDAQIKELEGQMYIADFPCVENKFSKAQQWPFAVVVPRKFLDLVYRGNCPNTIVDKWFIQFFKGNDVWVRLNSKTLHHQAWIDNSYSDTTYLEGRKAWDGGQLSGGRGGVSRGAIISGKLEGWYHWKSQDFINLQEYLKKNPNTKKIKTNTVYYKPNFVYPTEKEWTP